MASLYPRRSLLKLVSLIVPLGAMQLPTKLLALDASAEEDRKLPVPDIFPSQSHELVRETVLVSHFDLKRVKELVEARPSLARAAWDWGFGDWESALGAASHVGNRPIAEYLISKGARPSLFSATMLGQVDVVKAFVAAQPGVQRIRGPHSISLLAHAKAGGDAARPVFDYLQSLGDAGADPQVPLPDGDLARLTGTYVFGLSANQLVEVTVEKGLLTWTRKGTVGRPLFHLGDWTFYPWGAASTRIRFVEEHGGVRMTVNDPELVMSVLRKQEPK